MTRSTMLRPGLLIPSAAVIAVTLAGLTACSSGATDDQAGAATACPITVSDGWVKAAKVDMTAAFGTLTNTGSDDVTITGATSDAAQTVELHEVADSGGSMVMRPIEGGFTVPAGSTLALEPGGPHFMLMGLLRRVRAGETVTITVECADTGTATITAQAKVYGGADEHYEGTEIPSPTPSK